MFFPTITLIAVSLVVWIVWKTLRGTRPLAFVYPILLDQALDQDLRRLRQLLRDETEISDMERRRLQGLVLRMAAIRCQERPTSASFESEFAALLARFSDANSHD